MKPRLRRREREFAGVQPKNREIIDMIRRDGYIGVMFNKEYFMDAIVWAANMVYEYKDFYAPLEDRIAIPLSRLQVWKSDLINAHMLLIIYYNLKENFINVEEFRESLYTLAKFQEIAAEDANIVERWADYIVDAKEKMDMGDFSASDIGSLQGTEPIYERYKNMVADEVEQYKAEVEKVKI